MSLVPDYDESSEASDNSTATSSDETNSGTEEIKTSPPPKLDKLPTPGFIDDGNTSGTHSNTSVFTNPFIEAENAKKAILEKHVKMVNTQDNTQIINGKKICWNYRKGRCRFGHNCTYAHDSDIQKTKEQLDAAGQKQQVVLCQTDKKSASLEIKSSQNKKKRPGLTQGLVPGKKVMKIYHSQRSN